MDIQNSIEKIRLGEAFIPATSVEIESIQKIMEIVFPKQYIEFLKLTNGLNGNHFYLEPVTDLPKMNEVYQIKKRLPNWLRIGTDGGGYSILFNLSDKEPIPYLCEDGAMFEDSVIKQSDSFFEWLNKGVEMIYDIPNQEKSSELIQKEKEVKFKMLVKSAQESFKNKDYKKTVELFTEAQNIKQLESNLDFKYLEFAKKHL